MPSIVLNDEQVRVLTQSREPVELRDEQGNLLACLPVWSDDEIAEARRRLASEQKRWPSEKIQQFLAQLTKIQQQEGMDASKLQNALSRFRAGEFV
jgi:hypothetical protein